MLRRRETTSNMRLVVFPVERSYGFEMQRGDLSRCLLLL